METKYLMMACKLAIDFNKSTGLDERTAKHEAEQALHKAAIKHNPNKAGFSTFAHKVISNRLRSVSTKQALYRHREMLVDESETTDEATAMEKIGGTVDAVNFELRDILEQAIAQAIKQVGNDVIDTYLQSHDGYTIADLSRSKNLSRYKIVEQLELAERTIRTHTLSLL